MRGYSKLDCGIVDSSLWEMPHEYLRVWIAMLSKTDANGYVRVAAPAMARLCHLTREEFDRVIDTFTSPDPESRTPDHEGCRLAKVDGGWLILNYTKYREGLKQPDYSTGRVKKYRDKKKQCNGSSVLETDETIRNAYAEAEAEAVLNTSYSCAEPEATPSDSTPKDPVVSVFECSGNPKTWELRRSKFDQWVKAYGEQCDVKAELIKAKQWLADNPVKKKTARGMTAFLGGWLQRSINSGRATLPATSTKPQSKLPDRPLTASERCTIEMLEKAKRGDFSPTLYDA